MPKWTVKRFGKHRLEIEKEAVDPRQGEYALHINLICRKTQSAREPWGSIYGFFTSDEAREMGEYLGWKLEHPAS
jgi:hypothetical protein